MYALAYIPKEHEAPTVLPGKSLAAHDELYPVQADDSGQLYLDKARFAKAVEYFSNNPSPKAIADLIYLGNSNNVSLLMNDNEKSDYKHLIEQPDYGALEDIHKQKDKIFQVYKDIVNGIGQTFSGTDIEIVLHDTRNPLKSVVAIQNPISGRRLGDPTTDFGIQLIKNYSRLNGHGTNFISYGLTLKDGRKIKSSIVPLFHETYGLIGFICINIDISKMDGKDPKAITNFIENFKAISDNDKLTELIQNTNRNN